MNKKNKEWRDFWTGRLKRTHFNPKNQPNFILCRANADGGSMGYHHSSNQKDVTCKTCLKMAKSQERIAVRP